MNAAFSPLPGNSFDAYKASHLLWRAGFGGTFNEAEKLAKLGLDGAVDQLVKYTAAQEAPPSIVATPPEEPNVKGLPEIERQKVRNKFRGDETERTNELKFWWLNRMLSSTPGGAVPLLQEKMTLFWHGHFATSFNDKIERAYPLWRQNDMFRRFALAPFNELLEQLIRDPAMLVFLDNASSDKSHANENFARELMELHSMGVGNYTENDVKAAARALTGFSVDHETWTYRYNAAAHDESEKTYLGKTGNWSGDDVAESVAAFVKDLRAQNNSQRVLILAFSEFGRRVGENASSGTDHGAAAPMFLFGEKIKGGLLGIAPDLKNLIDGDLRHQIDVRQVYADVLEGWLGTPSEPVLGRKFEKFAVV